MSTPDGAPAFPSLWTNGANETIAGPNGQLMAPRDTVQLLGMSLRDYFAAKAMAALIVANTTLPESSPAHYSNVEIEGWGEHETNEIDADDKILRPLSHAGVLALQAFFIADAMLAEREVKR